MPESSKTTHDKGEVMKLTDLKVGDIIIVPYYDSLPCKVVNVDDEDSIQPVYVEWADGTATWPESKYDFSVVNK